MKDLYRRTNKSNPIPQIVKIDDLTGIHHRMTKELEALEAAEAEAQEMAEGDHFEETPVITAESLALPYHISSKNKKTPIFLPIWLEAHENDIAFRVSSSDTWSNTHLNFQTWQDFIPRLKAFALAQHLKWPFGGNSPAFSEDELTRVILRNNVIYEHATASFNFTTYDVRREQEGVNKNRRLQGDRIRCDVMIPAPGGIKSGPFWYARVLGIFHFEAYFDGSPSTQQFDFLWVRWLKSDATHPAGASALRLEMVKFPPLESPDAFAFIHPSLVLRPCHVIPAFSRGRKADLSMPSFAQEDRGDWNKYYISRYVLVICFALSIFLCDVMPFRFADRDLMMRYLGLGVGHLNAADFPREDRVLRKVPSGMHYTILPEIDPSPDEEVHVDDGDKNEEGNEVDEWLRTQVGGEEVTRGDYYDF